MDLEPYPAFEKINGLNALVRDPVNIQKNLSGPLAGIPLVIKANIAVEGLPHCGASPALRDNISVSNATAVNRLLEAGAVIVGQSSMHELAFGITSHNVEYGAVANPANPAHMAGGSSGGTAACVASGAVPMGLASDTGGSGRLPAAMCGCIGLRPTHGRYPGDGVLTLSGTMDTVTPMARDINSLALLDCVLAGEPIGEVNEKQITDITLGVVEEPLWQGIDQQMEAACKAKLEVLQAAGVKLVSLKAPGLVEAVGEIAMGIVLYETQHWWRSFLAEKGKSFDQFIPQIASPDVAGVFQMIVDGSAPSKDAYLEMVGPKRDSIRSTYNNLVREVDGLIMPTLPITAPRIEDIETVEINGNTHQLFDVMTSRELVASICGVPSISLPAGMLNGLPFGMEIIGNHNRDRDLLEVACRLEHILTGG